MIGIATGTGIETGTGIGTGIGSAICIAGNGLTGFRVLC